MAETILIICVILLIYSLSPAYRKNYDMFGKPRNKSYSSNKSIKTRKYRPVTGLKMVAIGKDYMGNPYAPEAHDYLLMDIDDRAFDKLNFRYTNQKGETKDHWAVKKYLVGTADGHAVYFVGKVKFRDEWEETYFFLSEMRNVKDPDFSQTFRDGFAWVQYVYATEGFAEEKPVSVAA